MGRCLLCHSVKTNEKLNYCQTTSNIYGQTHISPPLDVINSCSKYLKEFVQSVNWQMPVSEGEAFCKKCYDSTRKLSKLNIQIELIENEIMQLVSHITERIIHERRNYELETGSCSFAIQNNTLFVPSPNNSIQNPTQRWEEVEIEYFNQRNEHSGSGGSEGYFSSMASNNHEAVKLINSDSISVYVVPMDEEEDSSNSVSEAIITNSTSNIAPVSISTTTTTSPTTAATTAGKDDVKNMCISISKGFTKNENVVTTSDLHQRVNDGFECQKCHKKFTHLTILQRHDCDNPTYECEICHKSFSSPGSLKLHSRSHSGEKPHKCDYCGKGFGLPHHLRLHIRSHTGEKPYQCEFCEKRFSDYTYLMTHRRQHSTNESEKRKYKCDICLKRFTLFGTLKKHYRMHKGDTPYQCEVCGKSFVDTKRLQDHRFVHTKEKAHQCNSCGRSYKRLDTLKSHMLTHTQEKNFQCDQCGRSYHSHQSLRQHITTSHEEEGEFVCETCGKSCKNSTLLKNHKKIHEKKTKERKRIKCTICEKEFSENSGLLKHMKTAHIVTTGATITCTKCGVEYENVTALERHNKRRVGQGFRFKCKLCKEIVATRCELTCHFAEIHQGEQLPYKCKICHLTFKSKVELANHNTNHKCEPQPKQIKKLRRKHRKTIVTEHSETEEEEEDQETIKVERRKGRRINKSGNDEEKKPVVEKVKRGRGRPRKTEKIIVNTEESTSESGSENFDDVVVKTETNDWIKQEQEDFTDE